MCPPGLRQVDTDVLPRPRPRDGRAVLPPVQEAAVFLLFRPAPLIAAMMTKDRKEGAEVFTCHGPGCWLEVVDATYGELVGVHTYYYQTEGNFLILGIP